MKKDRVCLLFLFIATLFGKTVLSQDSIYDVSYFKPASNIQIWGLQALSDTRVWFAGRHGVWGYTEDAGKSWHIDSIKADTVYPMFRSISVLNDSTVLLLSVASPAYLFKTTDKGKTWRLVYKNNDKDIFFDCMEFRDSKHGFALGDPIGGAFQFILTEDAGEKWESIDLDGMPIADSGEGCFAASNSNIDMRGKHIWFATGGMHTRIFHSSDAGKHFRVYNSPLPEGKQMTGIYSIDFCNASTGAIAGGEWGKSDTTLTCLAITRDGGSTWTAIKQINPFFGSCVKFRNSNEFYVTGATGTYRYNIKNNKMVEIKDKSGVLLKFTSLRFSPSGNALWMSDVKGNIAMIKLNKK